MTTGTVQCLHPDDATLVAADLGATKVVLRTVSSGDRLEARASMPHLGSGAEELAWLVNWLRDQIGNSQQLPVAAVVAAAPEMRTDGRVHSWPNRSGWEGLHLESALQRALRCTVRVVGDGAAGAFGEAVTTGCHDLVYFGLGTGVAGGVVLNGQLHSDGRYTADLGHCIVEVPGHRCRCGGYGCLQTVVSAPSFARLAAEAAGRTVGWGELSDAWESGAGWTTSVVDRAVLALAVASANAARAFGVGTVVLGVVLWSLCRAFPAAFAKLWPIWDAAQVPMSSQGYWAATLRWSAPSCSHGRVWPGERT